MPTDRQGCARPFTGLRQLARGTGLRWVLAGALTGAVLLPAGAQVDPTTSEPDAPKPVLGDVTATPRATPAASTGGFSLGLLELIPFASVGYTDESNLFRFSREVADVTGTTDTTDRVQRYAAGVDARYRWKQQNLLASAEGRRLRYDNNPDLDHSEHQWLLSYVGRFYSHTSGLLTLSEERRIASFEDRRSTDLVIERDRTARAGIGVAVQPKWHIIGGVRHGQLDSPLPLAPALPLADIPGRPASPDFQLEETAILAGINYGIESLETPEREAPLLFRLVLEHEDVRFKNFVPDDDGQSAEDYDLLGLSATGQYAVSGLSRLNASLAATRFSAKSGGGSSVELTGEIRYTRAFSAVTEVNARVFRRFTPFVPSAGVTTDTGFGIGARWEPILDMALVLDYARTRNEFGVAAAGTGQNQGREDTTQSASVSIDYTRIEYFGLRVFAVRNDRDSNRTFNDFADERVGAELRFRWE